MSDFYDLAGLRMIEAAIRERFTAVLFTGPLLQANAIVCLCGEDAKARAETANSLFQSRGAPILCLSGGRHEPPSIQGADSVRAQLMGRGIASDRITIENASQNTRQQAENVLQIAKKAEWTHALLVASPYHLPRAFLTFVKAMDDAKIDTLRIVGVPSSHSPWLGSPEGMTETRLELLSREYVKIDEYQAKGHVASYERGLEYLKVWEGR